MAKRRTRTRTAPGKSSRGRSLSRKLPNGSYAWKGKAVSFAKLPKSERARWRSLRATQAAKTRRAAATITKSKTDTKRARDWLTRRTAWVPEHGSENQYAGMVPAREIADKLDASAILAIRDLQRKAHAHYAEQGHGGGAALQQAEVILDALGPELASMMPQLWWYH